MRRSTRVTLPRHDRRSRRSAVAGLTGAAVLVSGMALAAPAAGTGTEAAVAAGPVLAVDFAESTGPYFGGATGTLYGLSDAEVPAFDLVAGMRPRTVAQKAPGGAQHPNGDADVVAENFFAAGGEEVSIYMQDEYTQWPYEDLGFDDYFPRITRQVTEISSRPDSAGFSYVPFNEPDGIWYQNWATEKDNFLADWTAAYREIRRIDPDAVIVGPNESRYIPERLRDFLAYAKANDVLPDIMSWHELGTGSLVEYRDRYADYRSIERELGIDPLPININEYGNRRDMGDPGRMVQWFSLWEDTKVDGNMAYWTYAGNLSDHAARTQGGNGGWWLGKWYSDLTGDTVAVTPPQANTPDTYQGVAAIDRDRRQATLLVGGGDSDVTLDLDGLPRNLFGTSVDVRISRTGYTGQEGAATAPQVVSHERVALTRGGADIVLENDNQQHAYQVLITPGRGEAPAAPVVPWSTSVEAEDGELVDAAAFTQGGDWSYAASGGRDVGAMNRPSSSTSVEVTVPEDGTYDLGVLYGNNRLTGQLALSVDGEFREVVTFDATLGWTYRSRAVVPVELAAGTHTLTLATSGPDGYLPNSDITLDRFELGPSAPFTTTAYESDMRLTDGAGVQQRPTVRSGSATGRFATLPSEGGTATSYLAVEEDGYHRVTWNVIAREVGASLDVEIGRRALEGVDLDLARRGSFRASAVVFLEQGVHEIRTSATGGDVDLGSVTIERDEAGDAASTLVQAEDLELAGGAAVVDGAWAVGGRYVGGVGNGGSLTMERPEGSTAGQHVLTVGYANADRAEGHAYNTDVITRFLDATEAGAEGSQRSPYRHNYSWDGFWSQSSELDLATADGAVTLGNASQFGPNVDWVQLSPFVLDASVERR